MASSFSFKPIVTCKTLLVASLLILFIAASLPLRAASTGAGTCGLNAKPVRPVAEDWQSDYGIPGISLILFAAKSAHGTEDFEQGLLDLAPGVAFPIHFHDGQEEVIVLIKGSATSTIQFEDGRKDTFQMSANSTATFARGIVHDFTAGPEGAQAFVTISKPPIKMNVLKDWDTPKSEAADLGSPFDKCPPTDAKDEL